MPDVVVELGGVLVGELLAAVVEPLLVVLELLVAEPLEPQADSSNEQATTASALAGM